MALKKAQNKPDDKMAPKSSLAVAPILNFGMGCKKFKFYRVPS